MGKLRVSKTSVPIAIVVVATFCLAAIISLVGSPWSWATALAALAGAAAVLLLRQEREIRAIRGQIGRLGASMGETHDRVAGEHLAATAELTDEVRRLRDRLRATERVAGESWVRLQRYDLIQRPGGFEIELYCDACAAWRPSGVISTWEHFKRDEPFVTAEGRFILSCGHEVRADNYNARPGAKVAPTVRRLNPAADKTTAEPAARADDGPVALSG